MSLNAICENKIRAEISRSTVLSLFQIKLYVKNSFKYSQRINHLVGSRGLIRYIKWLPMMIMQCNKYVNFFILLFLHLIVSLV